DPGRDLSDGAGTFNKGINALTTGARSTTTVVGRKMILSGGLVCSDWYGLTMTRLHEPAASMLRLHSATTHHVIENATLTARLRENTYQMASSTPIGPTGRSTSSETSER